MSSTEKEKGLIKEWAANSESRIEMHGIKSECFWSKCDSSGDITEHDFHTVPELKNIFKEVLVGCEDVILPLTVATLKKKEQELVLKGSKERIELDDFSIPEYIYVF
ncbi:hypothetical protein QYZ88_006360 [Lachnospiraceae bacterium C1.1]|nr:hypothetical protein [Lachnospiraceae bacterium C1.1]